MTSFKPPTQQQIDTAVQRMRSPDLAAYFFARLDNPLWVVPLQERNLFSNPPSPSRVEDGSIYHPSWPASKYLARMARHAPSEVASIFKDFETANNIIGDILDAALLMPPAIAATLVPFVSQTAQMGTLGLHFKDASDLCIRLANGDELPAAMALAEALFAPQIESGQENFSRQDEYWYREGLKEVLPVLIKQMPHEVLLRLCNWLEVAINAKKTIDHHSGKDYSWMWRSAVEEHEQNKSYILAGVMVGFVRQGFEQAINNNLPMEDALPILERQKYFVFRRIRIHLINEFAEKSPRLARQCIMDQTLFYDLYYKHEYMKLVERRLGLLTKVERNTWFGWIEAGPNISDFNKSIKNEFGRDATDEERQNRKKYWQFEKLYCVRDHLDGKWQKFYEEMLAEYGEPELAYLNTRISIGYGHRSPISIDQLVTWTLEEVIERVVTWSHDERQSIEDNIEGLVSTFDQYIATDPEMFSTRAMSLVFAPAIYVGTFIHQMAEAIRASREIDIYTVLDLCRWVMGRPIDEGEVSAEEHDIIDNDWQWPRDEISQLLQNICAATYNSAPKYKLEGLREPIWLMLDELCRGNNASSFIHDISQDDPLTQDYLTLGINSSRGKAVGAALEYARWIADHHKEIVEKQEIVPGGFKIMPEVQDMLEWQIAPGNRSVEAMALIGSQMGLLCWIDREWLVNNANRLFYLDGITRTPPIVEGWSAWNAFLIWVRPHIEFYRIFKKQFAYSVAQAKDVKLTEPDCEEPMNYLGEHMMLLYGRGQLGFDDDEGVLRKFLKESNPVIRRHAIGFVGRCLQNDIDVPNETIDRLMVLWELYWSDIGKKDALEEPDAELFGTWFSSGLFPEGWALNHLEAYVEVVSIPEPDHAVMEQLLEIAPANILKAINILSHMVHGDREGWHVHGWQDSAKQILELAMKAGGSSRNHAIRIIDYLWRRGYTSFGDLINPNEPDKNEDIRIVQVSSIIE